MDRHPRRRTLLGSLGLVLLAACARGDAPVRIGLAGPFGDPVGAPMRLAAELAAAEINAAGGVGGRRLELVFREDYADPDSAVQAAAELYRSDVVAVVGHVFSGTTLAAAPVYNGGPNPLVAVSPSSSAPEVTEAGDYTFRVCPSDLAHGAALARWAQSGLGLRRAAVLYLNNEYGRGIRQTFAQEFGKLEGEVVELAPYLGDRPDVGPYVERIAARKRAQFVVVAGNRSEAEEVLRLMGAHKLSLPLMGGDALEGIEAAGAIAEGTYQSSAYLPDLDTPANRRFVEAFRNRFPDAGLPNQPAAAAYDAVHLLARVIARAGPDRRAVRDELAGVGTRTPPFEGVTGTIAFDEHGDVPRQPVVIGVVRGGRVHAVDGAHTEEGH